MCKPLSIFLYTLGYVPDFIILRTILEYEAIFTQVHLTCFS